MSATIRPVEYFTITVHDPQEAASELLSTLAANGIDLLAFSAIPVGLQATQLVVFPEDTARFELFARHPGFVLSGPERAFLIQGDDELGALARFHRQLADAGVHPFASTGVTDGKGGFGYILYIRESEFATAADALGVAALAAR